ncbi:MAG: xylose isomerase [Firmicutes bacterium HGW-Firmicutes-21]|nr:MAG: xylose isomerase [Firmicutes bacterium HGW-Firmicutes-21]
MAKFIFSAFADEIDPSLETQLDSLNKLGIGLIELRGVDGKSFVTLSDDEVMSVKQKLAEKNIGISALGSPIGKINADGDFKAHIELLVRIMDIGDMLGCKRIRMFSFYPAADMSDAAFEERAFSMVGELLDVAESRGFTLYHENEKDIYGDSPQRVEKLVKHFDGRLRVVLDPGNFAFCGIDGSPAYSLLKDYIDYMHIKDADTDGTIVPPGKGVALIKETLSALNKDRPEKEIIITMEPHLMMFTGLSSLSKLDDIKHKYSFSSPFEAFKSATEAVKDMVASLN